MYAFNRFWKRAAELPALNLLMNSIGVKPYVAFLCVLWRKIQRFNHFSMRKRIIQLINHFTNYPFSREYY